jgi:hypothetical protein
MSHGEMDDNVYVILIKPSAKSRDQKRISFNNVTFVYELLTDT